MKKSVLILLLVVVVGAGVYGQSSLSGRYVVSSSLYEDDIADSFYQYFEFLAGGKVRIGKMNGETISGPNIVYGMSRPFGDEYQVTVTIGGGSFVILEMEDRNTLLLDGYVFKKQ
jgi:hypothetical protein